MAAAAGTARPTRAAPTDGVGKGLPTYVKAVHDGCGVDAK